MAQHDFTLDNRSGLLVRQEINQIILALATMSSGATEPEELHEFMPWVDTSGASPILKFRNAANNGWITIGPVDQESFGFKGPTVSSSAPATTQDGQLWIDTSGANPIIKRRNVGNTAWIVVGRADLANYGLLPLTGGSLSGAVFFTNTDSIGLPVGTTAQRPGSPQNGYIRYNTDLQQFEGYRNGSWGSIGGGGIKEFTAQTSLADGGTISISALDPRQGGLVSAGAGTTATLSNTPFGNISSLSGITEVFLYNTNPDRSVFLTKNDANDGCIGNFDVIEIAPDMPVKCVLFPTTRRILVSRGV